MNFPGKINKFDSSGNYKFSSTIPHNKCTMYKGEPKDVKRKKPSWRISGQTHVAVSKLSQPCLGSTGENGRKRERKNHGFSCLLENLPYSKFNMYLRGWVLTFILILTGTTIDLPHFEGGVRVCGIRLFLVRCCGNFYFKVRYCSFPRPSGVRWV